MTSSGNFLRSAFINANLFLKEGGVFYIWHADSRATTSEGLQKEE